MPELSGGGDTTPEQRLVHSTTNRHGSPVRLSALLARGPLMNLDLAADDVHELSCGLAVRRGPVQRPTYLRH
jgi:hypothetical protein